jgi:hypothetical protein
MVEIAIPKLANRYYLGQFGASHFSYRAVPCTLYSPGHRGRPCTTKEVGFAVRAVIEGKFIGERASQCRTIAGKGT